MKTTVKTPNHCPHCGRTLPAGTLAGLCPGCLLAQGAETEAGDAEAPRFQAPSIAEIATLFPQLEILSLLGAGGMGAVYKARQPALDRLVALKVLPAGGRDGLQFEERFNREARALARLSHPNIVAVYEFGKVGGLHFFIMEFVDGANLRQLEKTGRLSPREGLQIIPQICDALQYAHDGGVVHRDIKPENVLVDRKGRVKIADFGLAKILDHTPETLRLTLDGQVMGTPHYMAPEQVEKPLTVDHRADIYSLGVVFYEMLTGELPLGKFSPPSRKVQVDVRLDEVVLRALENDPTRRYQNASEVKSQVETIACSPGQPGSKDSRNRLFQWSRRRVVWVSLFALVVLVAFIIPGVRNHRGAQGNSLNGKPEIDQVAVKDSNTGTLVAKLPGRGQVELLAVSEAESAPNAWWLPNGSAIPDALFELAWSADNQSSGRVRKDFIFQWSNLPAGASGPSLEFGEGAGGSGGGEVLRDGVVARHCWPVRGVFPPELKRATIRLGFELEAWKTVSRHDRNGNSSSSNFLPDAPRVQPQVHQIGEEAGQAQVTMLLNEQSSDWRARLVAIDTNGTEHTSVRASGTPAGQAAIWTYTFLGLPLTQVQEFQVQLRPIHWVEFRDIPLQPSEPSAVGRSARKFVPTRFSDVKEAHIAELFDFDSDMAGIFPTAEDGSQRYQGIERNPSWILQNGFDVDAGTNQLKLHQMNIVDLSPSDWDDMTPTELGRRLRTQTYGPSRLPSAPGALPVTHGFRTHQGGMGMLQITAFDKTQKGATVRYRIVERAHFE